MTGRRWSGAGGDGDRARLVELLLLHRSGVILLNISKATSVIPRQDERFLSFLFFISEELPDEDDEPRESGGGSWEDAGEVAVLIFLRGFGGDLERVRRGERGEEGDIDTDERGERE